MRITPKTKSKGIRDWIAWKLVDLAKWIRPKNEAAYSYIMEILMEAEAERLKYGKSDIEIKLKKKNLND